MGCFSWMFANLDNRKSLRIGRPAYVACPDGSFLYEPCYDGYGIFAGKDVYDLVADWNREYISVDNIEKPDRNKFSADEEGLQWYERNVSNYQMSCRRLSDFVEGKPDDYMLKTYGKYWKREIGIEIACYDEQNATLKYPIKICSSKKIGYDSLPASEGDPDQGFF